MKNIFSFKNLNKNTSYTSNKNFNLQFNTIFKKFLRQQYPNVAVRIDKNTGEAIPKDHDIIVKKAQDVKFSSKYEINPDNIHDYEIIGAEIFKNSFKDTIEKLNRSEPMDELMQIDQELEVYSAKVNPMKFQEPDKYNKHFTNRTFYDQADPRYRHMFVPSWKYKIEPFNSIPVLKWGYLNGDRESHNEIIFQRNSYIQNFFLTPFTLNNPEIENLITQLKNLSEKYKLDFASKEFHNTINDIYKKPETSEKEEIRAFAHIVENLLQIIPNLNHKIFPTLLMKLFFDANLNSKKLWIAMEQEILNNLHHYNIHEISQIAYIVTITSPKYTSENFRRILIDNALKSVEDKNLSLEELYAVCLGFRFTRNRMLYDKIAYNFIKRKDLFIGEGCDKKLVPTILANIFYSFANNRPKELSPRTYYPQLELIENFVETFEDDLNNNILKMSQDELSRFSTALYLLKTDNVDPFINRIERNLIKLKNSEGGVDKISAFNLHNIIRSFSKMRDGKMCGSDKFFEEMESIIINHINNFKFTFQQFTDILYAYSVRGSGSEKLLTLFNRKLNEDINQANNYHTIHNIFWHFLFTENKNSEQWNKILERFNLIPEKVPIHYYRPFKLASHYLQFHLNETERSKINAEAVEEFMDRFYDPEQIYDYVKMEKNVHKYKEFSSMKAMINGRLVLYPVSHLVIQNMFIVHFAWENRKMGINVWLERDKISKTSPVRINKQCYLHSKLLQNEGWEILDIVWEDFVNLGGQNERDKFIWDWYTKTSKIQEERGFVTLNPQFI